MKADSSGGPPDGVARPLSPLTGVAVAIGLVVVATIARVTITPVVGGVVPFAFHFVAVVLAAWVAGFGGGVVATVGGALAVDFFIMEPRHSLALVKSADIAATILFTLLSLGMSWQITRWRRVEHGLVESRDALRQRAETLALQGTLLDHAYDAIFVRDAQQRIIMWNREAERLYGWAADEAMGRDAHQLLGTEPDTQRALHAALATSGTWSGTITHRRRDGSRVLCESRQAVADSGLVLEVNRDITERVRAEQDARDAQDALRANERTLTALMDAATESIFLFDRERILAANATAALRLGTTVAEIRGAKWRALIPPDLAASRAARIDEVFATARPVQFEDQRAGMWFEHTFYPAFDSEGAVVAVAAFSRDTTQSRRTQAMLHEMSQRLAYHVSHSPLAVVEFGPDMRITGWTGEATRLFGWTAEEVIGKRMEEFPWVYEEDVVHVHDVAMDLQTGANVQRFSANRNRRKDGTVVFCEWYNSSLLDASGTLQSILSLVLDVTERKRLEEELRARAEELATANRLKDEFLATLSHELRTPLHAILGWSQLLATTEDLPASLERGLAIISRNAQIQGQLVGELLDVSRILTGSFRLDLQAVDLQAVVTHALDVIRPAADAKHLRIHVDLEPGVTFSADAVRLQQMMWNLVSNAVKFTPAGGAVAVSAHGTDREVEITVRDSGIGIDRDFLPHVFERFSQADSSLARVYGGLGLGLAIVRHIVELHGGTVTASSDGEGLGAVFTVRLPIRHAAGNDRGGTHEGPAEPV